MKDERETRKPFPEEWRWLFNEGVAAGRAEHEQIKQEQTAIVNWRDDVVALKQRISQFQFCIDRVAEALGNVCCGGVDSNHTEQLSDPHSTTRVLCDAIEKLKRERDAAADLAREEAARICEKRAEERFAEFGVVEDDTNAAYYDGNAADWRQAQDEEDENCAAAIRAIIADPAAVKRTLEDAARFRSLPKWIAAICWNKESNLPTLGHLKDGFSLDDLRAWLDDANAARKGEEGK